MNFENLKGISVALVTLIDQSSYLKLFLEAIFQSVSQVMFFNSWNAYYLVFLGTFFNEGRLFTKKNTQNRSSIMSFIRLF